MRLYNDIFDSPAWRSLDYSACCLWWAMRRQLKATNNGDIEATLGTLRHCGFSSPATIAKGLRALQAVGLIAVTRQGGIAVGQKVCNLYRFTDESTYPNTKLGLAFSTPTNNWKKFENLAAAGAAIAEAERQVVRKPRVDKPP